MSNIQAVYPQAMMHVCWLLNSGQSSADIASMQISNDEWFVCDVF